MYVIPQTRPATTPLPGVAHSTWAGHDQGLSQLSLWRQTLAPGAATPPHHHDSDELVLCLAGQGELHIAGEVHCFGAEHTLVLPARVPHQIFNTGAFPMETIGIFGATPVATYGPDGAALPLPWRS